MTVLLAYDPAMTGYRFGSSHPMRPERFSLAVDLATSWGLIAERPGGVTTSPRALRVSPEAASDDDLLLVHSPDYVSFVAAASRAPFQAAGSGLGPGDTPAFADMHEITKLIVGGTMRAVDAVLEGVATRSFAPAGGLHHAQRDRAEGFCVYNDLAIAIERATRERPGLRVAYVDIDAHHGDGVENAFAERLDVLTLSVHESGRYLFPGTGRATDVGTGAGRGSILNVPLPPDAGPDCYKLVMRDVIAPALAAFAPDLVVAQIGADTHRSDPLTHLSQTIAGFFDTVTALIGLADEAAGGRIVLTGGGGYRPFSEVPRMWAGALALILGTDVPEELPADWIERARAQAMAAGHEPTDVTRTLEETLPELDPTRLRAAYESTEFVVRQVQAASPLLSAAS